MYKLPDHLAKEFHPTLNKGSTIDTVKASEKIWWLGTCKHEWQAIVQNRVRLQTGCPYCANKAILSGYNDLATTNPKEAANWHPTKNGSLDSSMVMKSNKHSFWWKETVCGHEYQISPERKVKAKRCFVCSNRIIIAGINDLTTVNPLLAAEWHPTKNSKITPQEVSIGKNLSVWWSCSKGHEWEAVINDRQHDGCPFCSKKRIIAGDNDFLTTHPEIAKEWHPTKNANLASKSIPYGADIKVWWLCDKGHEWEAYVYSRANGNGCAICSQKKIFTGFNDLVTLAPAYLKEWHPTKNKTKQVNGLGKGNNDSTVWWLCDKGHEWQSSIANREKGKGCQKCFSGSHTSSGETALKELFESLGLNFEQNNRTILNGQELDFYFPEQGIAVEYNGLYWHSEAKKDKNYHYNKWINAELMGVQLIQIWEDDWNNNKTIVSRTLAHKLGVLHKLQEVFPEDKTYVERIFARKLQVVESNTKTARDFFDNNHIQGFASASYYLSLMDENDCIRAMLAIKKEKSGTFNIVRYATVGNVVGGFTKLLKNFERQYNPEIIITFSDHSVSDGKLYEKSGFEVDALLPPDYTYLKNHKRNHKFGFRLAKFKNDSSLEYVEGMTETQLAKLNNLVRIWDSGKTRWIKSSSNTHKNVSK